MIEDASRHSSCMCHAMLGHDIPSSGARYRHVILLCCESLLPRHILVFFQLGLNTGNFLLQKMLIVIVYAIEPVEQ